MSWSMVDSSPCISVCLYALAIKMDICRWQISKHDKASRCIAGQIIGLHGEWFIPTRDVTPQQKQTSKENWHESQDQNGFIWGLINQYQFISITLNFEVNAGSLRRPWPWGNPSCWRDSKKLDWTLHRQFNSRAYWRSLQGRACWRRHQVPGSRNRRGDGVHKMVPRTHGEK